MSIDYFVVFIREYVGTNKGISTALKPVVKDKFRQYDSSQ